MKRPLFILFLFICQTRLCQSQSMSFSRIGSLGALAGTNYTASLAASFNNASECIKLNTGVALFAGTMGKKEFVAICKPLLVEEKIEFTLFPNPVENYTRLVATGLPVSLDQIQVIIVDAAGRTVLSEKIACSRLRTGYSFYLNRLSAGNYFLRIYANGLTRIIPFVKVL